jgi:putative NIF3 family GTP cyclohydrolase 1 type 2
MFLEEIKSLLENKISPKLFKLNSEIYGVHFGQKNKDKLIKKVMLTLNLSLAAIHHAIKNKISLIISHHGLINKPIKNFNNRLVNKFTLLTKYPISVFVLNTPFIAAEGGISDTIREILFLKLDRTFDIKNKKGIKIPLGRICIPQEYPNQKSSFCLEDLLKRIKSNIGVGNLIYVGDLGKSINKICIIGSNNTDLKYLQKAIKLGCDCYITGGMNYDEIVYAKETGVTLVSIPYFTFEAKALKKLCNILSLEFPRDEIFMYESDDPIHIY